jgi:hypothetical protein
MFVMQRLVWLYAGACALTALAGCNDASIGDPGGTGATGGDGSAATGGVGGMAATGGVGGMAAAGGVGGTAAAGGVGGMDATGGVGGAGTGGIGAGGAGGAAGAAGASGASGAGGSDSGLDGGVDSGVDSGTPLPVPCVCDGSAAPSAICKPECDLAFEVLFDQQQLPAFYLTIFDNNGGGGASSWQNLMVNCVKAEANSVNPPPECDHQIGTFHAVYDPDPTDGVVETVTTNEIEMGIHRKGRASWDDVKPSFKVKFTEFGGQRFMGLTRLTLNNVKQDPSMLRERVTYSVYRAAGLPAPLANNALVYIRQNNAEAYEYYGVYANIQTLDRRFVEYHYQEVNDKVGNLFDTYNNVYFTELDRSTCRSQAGTAAGAQEARFELETNENDCTGLLQAPCGTYAGCSWNGSACVTSRADLTALINSVFKAGCTNDGNTSCLISPGNRCCCPTAWDQTNFFENVSAVADTAELLTTFAVEAVLTNWDGFAGTRNNYKLYHDLVSNKFVMFPWGTDQTLGYQDGVYYVNWWYDIDHTESHRQPRALFMVRCEDDPSDCWAKYLAEVDAMNTLFSGLPLAADVDDWEVQIEDEVMADTKKDTFYNFARFRSNVTEVRHFLANRAACVDQQLAGTSCANLTCPGGTTDCNATTNW